MLTGRKDSCKDCTNLSSRSAYCCHRFIMVSLACSANELSNIVKVAYLIQIAIKVSLSGRNFKKIKYEQHG
jgi:hypothetical protein